MNVESVVNTIRILKIKRFKFRGSKSDNVGDKGSLFQLAKKCSSEACSVIWKPSITPDAKIDKLD